MLTACLTTGATSSTSPSASTSPDMPPRPLPRQNDKSRLYLDLGVVLSPDYLAAFICPQVVKGSPGEKAHGDCQRRSLFKSPCYILTPHTMCLPYWLRTPNRGCRG